MSATPQPDTARQSYQGNGSTVDDDSLRFADGLAAERESSGPNKRPTEQPAAPVGLPDAPGELSIVRLCDVKIRPVEWLWTDRIPLGKLSLLCGDPGLGKSFLTLDLAARVSRGAELPGTYRKAPQGTAILFSAEDDVEDTITPRAVQAGADLSRILAVNGIQFQDGGRKEFDLANDLFKLERLLEETADTRLLVIDPISAFCGRTDSHKNAEVRSLLTPLAALAGKFHVAVVAVSHLSKGAGGKAVYRAMGSLAFAAAARAVWQVAKDKDDDDRRLFLPVKMNLSRNPMGLAYRIIDGRRLEWEPDPVLMTADDYLAAETAKPEGDPTERERAAEWLREQLMNGPLPARDVQRQSRECGFTPATLRRAQRALGIRSVKEGYDKGTRWVWHLPEMPKMLTASEDAHPSDVSTFDESEHLRRIEGTEDSPDCQSATDDDW